MKITKSRLKKQPAGTVVRGVAGKYAEVVGRYGKLKGKYSTLPAKSAEVYRELERSGMK